jgi:hypothetical protein
VQYETSPRLPRKTNGLTTLIFIPIKLAYEIHADFNVCPSEWFNSSGFETLQTPTHSLRLLSNITLVTLLTASAKRQFNTRCHCGSLDLSSVFIFFPLKTDKKEEEEEEEKGKYGV